MTAFEDIARWARQRLLDRGNLPPLIVLSGAGWSDRVELYAFPADPDRQHTVLASLAIERALCAPRARPPLQRLIWISEVCQGAPSMRPALPASLTTQVDACCARGASYPATAEATPCAGSAAPHVPLKRPVTAAPKPTDTPGAQADLVAVGRLYLGDRQEPHQERHQEPREAAGYASEHAYGALQMALTAEGVTQKTRMLLARLVRDVRGRLVGIDVFAPAPPNPQLKRLLDTYRAGYQLARCRLG